VRIFHPLGKNQQSHAGTLAALCELCASALAFFSPPTKC
jgi:hypothetical protein